MSRHDFDSLTPNRDVSRRDVVGTLVGSGFAAAARPVMAQTVVKTDTVGLIVGEVTTPAGDVKMLDATVAEARPQGALTVGSAAAEQSEFVVYPNAPHAFHADDRPSFRKVAAEDGWQRSLAWFKSQGVA